MRLWVRIRSQVLATLIFGFFVFSLSHPPDAQPIPFIKLSNPTWTFILSKQPASPRDISGRDTRRAKTGDPGGVKHYHNNINYPHILYKTKGSRAYSFKRKYQTTKQKQNNNPITTRKSSKKWRQRGQNRGWTSPFLTHTAIRGDTIVGISRHVRTYQSSPPYIHAFSSEGEYHFLRRKPAFPSKKIYFCSD